MLVLCVFLSVIKMPGSGHKLLSLKPAAEQGFPQPRFFHSPHILVKFLLLQLTACRKVFLTALTKVSPWPR